MAPTLSVVDTLRFQWHVAGPTVLSGSVAPNPRFVPRLVRGHTAANTLRFLRNVRQAYGPRAWFWFPPWTLLVLDREGIEEVLSSHDNFADPISKKVVLSRFTPGGVIVSRGGEWAERRRLNEDALAFGEPLHPAGDRFIQVVENEVER